MNNYTHALRASFLFRLDSPLLLSTGEEGEFADSSIDKTPDGKLHVNGYVWSSLLRRAIRRLKGGEAFAKQIGKFEENDMQVSPLWCESAFTDTKLPETDIKPGNRINRQYGCADEGALYSDEIVPPGLELVLNITCFDNNEEGLKKKQALFQDALFVIKSGIETIGGGWSYGLGRLEVLEAGFELLDFSNKDDREKLWIFDDIKREHVNKSIEEDRIEKKWRWKRIPVTAGILKGQLLAVHSSYPAFDTFHEELPDHFVYRRYRINAEDKPESEVVIPGKAIRQAILSGPIERELRTKGDDICSNPSDKCTCSTCEEFRKNNNNKKTRRSPDCKCKRCSWFGSTEKGGIIAVTDALIEEPAIEIIKRIHLCEHSMQNINFFSGEYLTSDSSEFKFDILIDSGRCSKNADELEGHILQLLNELKGNGNTPPGWYRLGATSTCTGQIEIKSWSNADNE